MGGLIFLKFGGSLITDKDQPRTARLDVLEQLSLEIQQACRSNPELSLLIGHGSGSFGHQSASHHKTIDGVQSPEQWAGFAEVWKDARDLNQIVVDSLFKSGLQVIAIPPAAWMVTHNRQISSSFTAPIHAALNARLIPVVQGDVVFDSNLGGTILSTEDVFSHLALTLCPDRILLAGIEPGIWGDFPICSHLIQNLNPDNFSKFSISGSSSVDVTGGMHQKVTSMLKILENFPKTKVSIFSGLQPGNLLSALSGKFPGTTLSVPAS